MIQFEMRLSSLDESLYSAVLSQMNGADRRAMLALQTAVREACPGYTYMEIGSYLGGSLQPLLMDPLCRLVYSIDKRQVAAPDARGTSEYPENSTENMLAGLKAVPGGDLSKLVCLDGDASEIPGEKVTSRPFFCFIDGEHTKRAVLSDFRFCLSVLAPGGVIAFHDAYLVYPALIRILRTLRREGRALHAYALSYSVFVIELGGPLGSGASELKGVEKWPHRPYFLRQMVLAIEKWPGMGTGLGRRWIYPVLTDAASLYLRFSLPAGAVSAAD